MVLNLRMRESVSELGEVVVKPRVNKQLPLNEMAQVGARMFSVEEATRYAGGMADPARTASMFAGVASGGVTNGISIHGNSPEMLQWRVEGIEHAAGVRRIVGDSSEVIGDYDLVLITSPQLEHVWEQNTCTSEDIREITIQFDFGMSEDSLFGRNPFFSVRKMMNEARKGLCFPLSAIMGVYKELDTLSSIKDGFYAVMQFMTILYELSRCEGARTLASSSFAKIAVEDDSRRILKVKNFINACLYGRRTG